MRQNIASKLPREWARTTIGDICTLINGRAFKPKEWSSEGIPIIRIQNLNDETIDFNYCNFSVEEKYHVENEQLLFAWSGTPGTSFGAHIWKRGKAVLNQHIFKVEIDDNYLNKIFLMYLLNWNVTNFIRQAHGTAGLAHITKGKFENSILEIPPLPEQHRIANKIEELFTRLDAGVDALNKIRLQLKRYRQAILKYAFEGKLTAEWREAHKTELEPATILLERIKKDRKERVKNITRPEIDTSNLPHLPYGWAWARLNSIVESMKNGIYKPPQFYADKGIACLRMYNIENGSIVWKDIKRMNLTPDEVKEYELKPDDILVNRVNSRELVGKAAPIPKGLESCVYESKNIRLRLNTSYARTRFVSYWLLLYSQQFFNRNAQQTVGMASINQEQLNSMPIPFTGVCEQQKILDEIDRYFSVTDQIEKAVEQSVIQVEKLRQSILKKAFEGRLVSQNPTDEPAEKLLERIKAEKAKRVR